MVHNIDHAHEVSDGRIPLMRSVLFCIGVALLCACSGPVAQSPTAESTLPSLSATLPVVSGQLPPKSEGKLSARLEMLASPEVSAGDSAAQARALGLPETGSGSLVHNDEGAVLVVVRASNVTQPTLDALAAAGFATTHVAEEFSSVTGYARPDQLAVLAALPAVENIREELSP